jgi:predicted Zn-dependent protease
MDRIITKTLADLYLQQGHFQEAYKIYKALSERDPSDKEIQSKLKELRAKLKPPPQTDAPPRSTEEKIRTLERWLDNIRKRKRR